MGQLFAPRAFGSKKCVVLAFVVRPTIHSRFEFTSAEASGNLGFLLEESAADFERNDNAADCTPSLTGIHSRARYPDAGEAMACMGVVNK